MRKIEQLMNAACKAKINFTRANTSVSYDDTCDESNVYLHGNHIATVGSNFLHIFDGGWQSVTTKSRLNALVNEFANPFTCGVYQKDFTWYVTDRGTTSQFNSTEGYLFQ